MTTASVFNSMFGFGATEIVDPVPQGPDVAGTLLWDAKQFAEEQVRSLVRQIFFQADDSRYRQVAFSGVDADANVRGICIRVGHALAAQTSGSICIVEVAEPCKRTPGQFQQATSLASREDGVEFLRDSAFQLSRNLWLVSSQTFLRGEITLSALWLRSRLDELRLDFDYTLFHAPDAAHSSDALVLGQICDGVVLVLCANSTRRVTALNTKQRLASANARVLGTILSDRKFPIPQGIYRRL